VLPAPDVLLVLWEDDPEGNLEEELVKLPSEELAPSLVREGQQLLVDGRPVEVCEPQSGFVWKTLRHILLVDPTSSPSL
jgi:hypothetical protein